MSRNVQDSQITPIDISKPIIKSPVSTKQKFLELWKANRAQILLWLNFRIFLSIVPIIAFALFASQVPIFKDNLPIGGMWTDRILGSWARWDGLHYIQIAQYGYTPIRLVAFYPLYVALMRGVAFVIAFGQINSVSLALAGVLISSLAALATCILLYQLGCLDYTRKTAARSVLYLMCFPMSFFLFAVYTEALFMALAIGAFYAARKNRWLLALILTSLAVLTKNQGLVLAVALLAEYARQREWKLSKLDVRLLYFALPVVAFMGWLAFNWLAFGDPLEFISTNKIYWNRYAAWPWQTLLDATNLWLHPLTIPDRVAAVSNLLNYPFTIAFLILFAVAGWLTWKGRFRLSYFLFFAGCLFQSLCLPIVNNPLNSLPRYLMLIFPIFFLLAQIGKHSRLFHLLYLTISISLLVALTAASSIGVWIA